MMLKLFSRSCVDGAASRGFTLLEVLVASGLSLGLMAMVLSSVLSNRRLYREDLVRTKINQNLRSAFDVLGADLREAGENLVPTFPAVELIDGAAGAPDQLVIRRNLLDEVLKVCSSIGPSYTVSSQIYFGNSSGAIPGCDYSSLLQNYTNWREHRIEKGGTTKAYIYDSGARAGEFFNYISEVDTGSQFYLTTGTSSWSNDYTTVTGAVYMLEEWHYSLNGGVLQLVIDDDTSNPMNVVSELTNFQVTLTMNDGSTRTAFAATDDWTDIQAIRVALTGSDTAAGRQIVRTMTQDFFPRNILSH